MNTLIEQIKKGQEIFDKQFSEQGDVVQFLVTKYGTSIHHKAWLETFKSFHTAFLISLLEGERGRKVQLQNTIAVEASEFNQGQHEQIDNDISHIDEALAYLKTNV